MQSNHFFSLYAGSTSSRSPRRVCILFTWYSTCVLPSSFFGGRVRMHHACVMLGVQAAHLTGLLRFVRGINRGTHITRKGHIVFDAIVARVKMRDKSTFLVDYAERFKAGHIHFTATYRSVHARDDHMTIQTNSGASIFDNSITHRGATIALHVCFDCGEQKNIRSRDAYTFFIFDLCGVQHPRCALAHCSSNCCRPQSRRTEREAIVCHASSFFSCRTLIVV